MTRYNLALTDFFHGEEVLRERIATGLIPPTVGQALGESKTAAARALDGLEAALAGFDPTLIDAVRKSSRKVNYQFTKIERKIGREGLIRDERATRDAGYLYGLIYPQKHLQERLYSILPFLAKHGFGLMDQLYESIHLDCPDHQLLVI
jgi:hypothetical protein